MKKLLLFTFLSIFGLSEMNAQLFISEVADPADISNAKFVELFNAGDVDIDFSSGSYYIVRQANGGGYGNVQLTGTISAKGTFVVAYNQSSYTSAYGSEANMYDNIVSGNGDDGYFLYIGGDQTTGTLVDAYGVPD